MREPLTVTIMQESALHTFGRMAMCIAERSTGKGVQRSNKDQPQHFKKLKLFSHY